MCPRPTLFAKLPFRASLTAFSNISSLDKIHMQTVFAMAISQTLCMTHLGWSTASFEDHSHLGAGILSHVQDCASLGDEGAEIKSWHAQATRILICVPYQHSHKSFGRA